MKDSVLTEKAPRPVGPYSQAVRAGGFVFVSGQLPLDPVSGTMPDSVQEQAVQSMRNVGAVLEKAGLSFADVVKTTVFLADIADFPAVNAVYASFFCEPFPARSCFAVKSLPSAAKVEIEVIAAES